MSDQETEEPSIEEILSSIRQIISDDDEDGEDTDVADNEEKVMDYSEEEDTHEAAVDLSQEEEEGASSDLDLSEEEQVSEPPAEEPAAEEDVIELTEVAEEEPAAEEPEPEAEPEAAPEPEPEPEDAEPEPEAIEVDMQDAEDNVEDEQDTAMTDDSLDAFDEEVLTTEAKAAALDGFSELAKKTAIETNGITIEDIVRSELNPLLRDWLDRHLPSIIERLVQEELDKIAKRAMDEEG